MLPRRLFELSLVVALCACSANLAVGPTSPRPNVMVPADKSPAGLVLGAAVRDEFVIPATGSVNKVPVKGWRSTLTSGFRNAFSSSANERGRKLELIEADLSFAPAAVTAHSGTAAVVATVRFKARLLDADGAELAAFAGTTRAREANTSASEAGMSDNAGKAVEALYETLSTELLAK